MAVIICGALDAASDRLITGSLCDLGTYAYELLTIVELAIRRI